MGAARADDQAEDPPGTASPEDRLTLVYGVLTRTKLRRK